jgi:transcriptional regulator with XRE-family HTH domain
VAIRELLDHGFTRSEVARRLGVTPAVITKVLSRPVVSPA